MHVVMALVDIVHVHADRADPATAIVAAGMVMNVVTQAALDLVAAIGPALGVLGMLVLSHNILLSGNEH